MVTSAKTGEKRKRNQGWGGGRSRTGYLQGGYTSTSDYGARAGSSAVRSFPPVAPQAPVNFEPAASFVDEDVIVAIEGIGPDVDGDAIVAIGGGGASSSSDDELRETVESNEGGLSALTSIVDSPSFEKPPSQSAFTAEEEEEEGLGEEDIIEDVTPII